MARGGLVMSVGKTKPGELRLEAFFEELVEMINQKADISEVMLGDFPQGNRHNSATLSHAGKLRVGGPLGEWLGKALDLWQSIPRGLLDVLMAGEPYSFAARRLLKIFGPKLTASLSRPRSVTGATNTFSLGGAVEDNRAESTFFDAVASYRVSVRTGRDMEWDSAGIVTDGRPGDVPTARLMVPHTLTDSVPGQTVQKPVGERTTELPEHFAAAVTNTEELVDVTSGLLTALGTGFAEVGSFARSQVRTLMTMELPGSLDVAANDPIGLMRPITDESGRDVAMVRVRTRVVVDESEMVGGPSKAHWLERLRIWFSTISASRGYNASVNVGSEAGPDLTKLGWKNPDVQPGEGKAKPGLSGAIGWFRSLVSGATASTTSIEPSVQRQTGHSQAYKLKLVHEVTVHLIEEGRTLDPVTVDADALVRMTEADAHDYGLPVDKNIFVTDSEGNPELNPDGTPRRRDDARDVAPPGRTKEVPPVLNGEMRGNGMALVENFTGIMAARADLEEHLREQGYLPQLDEHGMPIRTGTALEHRSRIANMLEVARQFNRYAMETGYNQASQSGIVLDLTVNKPGRNPTQMTVTVKVGLKSGLTYGGFTKAKMAVKLDIGSNTTVNNYGVNEGWNRGYNAGFGKGPADGLTGNEGGLNFNRGKNGNAGENDSNGVTTNGVWLAEGKGSVNLDGAITIEVEARERDRARNRLTPARTTVRCAWWRRTAWSRRPRRTRRPRPRRRGRPR